MKGWRNGGKRDETMEDLKEGGMEGWRMSKMERRREGE